MKSIHGLLQTGAIIVSPIFLAKDRVAGIYHKLELENTTRTSNTFQMLCESWEFTSLHYSCQLHRLARLFIQSVSEAFNLEDCEYILVLPDLYTCLIFSTRFQKPTRSDSGPPAPGSAIRFHPRDLPWGQGCECTLEKVVIPFRVPLFMKLYSNRDDVTCTADHLGDLRFRFVDIPNCRREECILVDVRGLHVIQPIRKSRISLSLQLSTTACF